jgi:hypothetical protein
LPTKPIIDMVLEVPDSSDELAYVRALEAAGYCRWGWWPIFFQTLICACGNAVMTPSR